MGANFNCEDRSKQLLTSVVALQHKIIVEQLGAEVSLNLIVEEARQLTHADGSDVGLQEGDELVYRAATGSARRNLRARLPLASAVTRRCVLDGKVLRSNDIKRSDSSATLEGFHRVDARSVIAVPVYQAQTVVGWLEIISSSADAFTDEDIRALQLLSPLVTLALARGAECELYEKLSNEEAVLKEMATTLGVIEQLCARSAEHVIESSVQGERLNAAELKTTVADIQTRVQKLLARLSDAIQRYQHAKGTEKARRFESSPLGADNPHSSADHDDEDSR